MTLTVEIKINGALIASAQIRNRSELAELSDYHVGWVENAELDLGIPLSTGVFVIKDHRRRQSAWALVAKVVQGILGQMIDEAEGKR